MNEPSFTNREIDAKLREQTQEIDRKSSQQNAEMKEFISGLIKPLTEQVTKTNGRVTKMERNLLVVAVASITYAALNYPQVLKVIQMFV